MKDQYVGDIGDYTKFGILRNLLSHIGLSLGVNWYLTPDDNVKKDGRHTSYLERECDAGDNELFIAMKQIAGRDCNISLRNITQLQELALLKGASYYDKHLDYSECKNACERLILRDNWHRNALLHLKQRQLVFLDPDNGLTFTNAYGRDGNKGTTYEEVCDYYRNGASVIIYNHRDRSPIHEYLYRLNRFKTIEATANAFMQCIVAPKYTQRDYLFIVQPNHKEQVLQATHCILNSDWYKNGYLFMRNLLTGNLINKK